MSEDRDEYLAALEEARAEREQLHPHAPVLPPERHLRSVPASPPALDDSSSPFALDERFIELGRRRLAEMRELIARHTTHRRPSA